MTIHFEGASERRKELVQAFAEATGAESKYLGAPRFDYQVGGYIIHKDGSVDADDLMDAKEIGLTLHALRAKGFIATNSEWGQMEEAPAEKELPESIRHEDGIALSFSKEGLSAESIANVRKLIAAKAPLIKLALELDELPIEEEDDKLTFTWLPITAPHEMVEATAQLLAAILKLVKRLKRVTVVERETDNPRYTFRCFLLRLGFIGDEYRTTRKYLMKGMPGNGSQRHMAVEDEESVQDNAQDEPIEVERIEKLETQTDVVTEEELAALPADEADAPADDSGALPAENAPAENAPAGESAE